MARHTRHVAGLVLTASPEHLFALRVALEADGVLVHGFQDRRLAETEIIGGIRLILEMLAAWPVTGLTAVRLKIAFGKLGSQKLPVQGVLHFLELIFVAPLARLAPDIRRPGDRWSRSVGLDA